MQILGEIFEHSVGFLVEKGFAWCNIFARITEVTFAEIIISAVQGGFLMLLAVGLFQSHSRPISHFVCADFFKEEIVKLLPFRHTDWDIPKYSTLKTSAQIETVVKNENCLLRCLNCPFFGCQRTKICYLQLELPKQDQNPAEIGHLWPLSFCFTTWPRGSFPPKSPKMTLSLSLVWDGHSVTTLPGSTSTTWVKSDVVFLWAANWDSSNRDPTVPQGRRTLGMDRVPRGSLSEWAILVHATQSKPCDSVEKCRHNVMPYV